MKPSITIADNYQALCVKITQEMLLFSNQQLKTQPTFTLVLSGGSTPKGVYECMASPAFRSKFQWKKIHIFWSDERWVSHDDPRSNFRMTVDAMLSAIPIPAANVHPISTGEKTVSESAEQFEGEIRQFLKLKKGAWPRFDLILLGVGEDGHTASLFPGTPSLLVKNRIAVESTPKGIPEPRISLSFPAINHAHAVFFLVSGVKKADIMARILSPKKIFPAQQIHPQGELRWFLDQDAATELPGKPKRIGLAADHGGFVLKEYLKGLLKKAGYQVIDFGNKRLDLDDDFPDFVVPLCRAVASGKVDRGIALCGSGVGACITANKVKGVRACMVHEKFSATQGVEDDDMNVICLGSKVLNETFAWELVQNFLSAHFTRAQRYTRRLAKIAALERRR